jgi:hypothetical protein
VRPRQARYQAALRPDMKCSIDSKALSNFAPIQTTSKSLDCTKTVPNAFTGQALYQNPAAFRSPSGSSSPRLLVSSAISFENTF